MDNYCIALLVLVLFFLYVDNENKTEGYLEYAPVDYKSKGSVHKEQGNLPEAKAYHQDYKPIGQVPQKVSMEAPPSMTASLGSLSGAPSNMGDYMLLHDESEVYDVVPADLPMAYPRVGAPDNLGRDTSFEEKEVDSQMFPGYDGSEEPRLTVDQQIAHHTGKPSVPVSDKKLEVHMVYADWCGHSRNAKPDFAKFKSEYDGKQVGDYTVSVQDHEIDKDPSAKELSEKHDIQGFPTHFIIKDGEKIDTGRSYDELSGHVNELCN